MERPSVVTSILAITLLFFRLQLFIDWRHHTSPLTRGLSRPAGRMVATAQPKTVDHEKMWISLKVCDQGCDHQYRTVVA
mgnify:FL=1